MNAEIDPEFEEYLTGYAKSIVRLAHSSFYGENYETLFPDEAAEPAPLDHTIPSVRGALRLRWSIEDIVVSEDLVEEFVGRRAKREETGSSSVREWSQIVHVRTWMSKEINEELFARLSRGVPKDVAKEAREILDSWRRVGEPRTPTSAPRRRFPCRSIGSGGFRSEPGPSQEFLSAVDDLLRQYRKSL